MSDVLIIIPLAGVKSLAIAEDLQGSGDNTLQKRPTQHSIPELWGRPVWEEDMGQRVERTLHNSPPSMLSEPWPPSLRCSPLIPQFGWGHSAKTCHCAASLAWLIETNAFGSWLPDNAPGIPTTQLVWWGRSSAPGNGKGCLQKTWCTGSW